MEKRYTGFVEKKCEQCGLMFKTRDAEINRGNGRFCGRACAAMNGNEKRWGEVKYCFFKCLWCGCNFRRTQTYIKRTKTLGGFPVYCSRDCSCKGIGYNRKMEAIKNAGSAKCKQCGKEFLLYKKAGQIYCSNSCRQLGARKRPMGDYTFSDRFDVLNRDGFTCQYCGRAPWKDKDVTLEVDHINPRALGGSDNIGNLVTSCRECNQGKKARNYNITFKGRELISV